MNKLLCLVIAVSLACSSVLHGCGSSGPSAADIQKKHDLDDALTSLSAKRKDRDSAIASEDALEKQAAKAESEMTAVAGKADEVDGVVAGWTDDYRANIRDADPTSIEKMVRQSSSFMADLKDLKIEDTPSSYQSAFRKYVEACDDLGVGERVRLKIDYVHLNLADKISSVPDSDLSDEEKQKLNRFKTGADVATLADWTSQNSDNNEAIDKAVTDIKTTKAALATERESAPQSLASQIQTLKSQIETMNQAIAEAESKVKSLGGSV